MAEADQRDLDADARDEGTSKRSRERNWEEFTFEESSYGEHLPERREAALDRGHAMVASFPGGPGRPDRGP